MSRMMASRIVEMASEQPRSENVRQRGRPGTSAKKSHRWSRPRSGCRPARRTGSRSPCRRPARRPSAGASAEGDEAEALPPRGGVERRRFVHRVRNGVQPGEQDHYPVARAFPGRAPLRGRTPQSRRHRHGGPELPLRRRHPGAPRRGRHPGHDPVLAHCLNRPNSVAACVPVWRSSGGQRDGEGHVLAVALAGGDG